MDYNGGASQVSYWIITGMNYYCTIMEKITEHCLLHSVVNNVLPVSGVIIMNKQVSVKRSAL